MLLCTHTHVLTCTPYTLYTLYTGIQASLKYNKSIRTYTLLYAILDHLRKLKTGTSTSVFKEEMWIHYNIKKRNILHQIYEWNLQDSMVGKELIGMLSDPAFFTSRPEGPVPTTTTATGAAATQLTSVESNMKVNPSTSILSTIASAATAALDMIVGEEEEEQEGEDEECDDDEGGV